MALEQDMVIDLIQILPDRQIQVRQIRRFLDAGEVVGTGPYHRFVLDPGIHDPKDVPTINDDLGKIATALWTPEVIDARKRFMAEQDRKQAALVAANVGVPTPPAPPVTAPPGKP